MALLVGWSKFRVALAALTLLVAIALAIGFAAHGQWLVSGLCLIASLGPAASLYLRIQLVKWKKSPL
jgi:hypothetical protein